jgi:predicted dienelactone hydrolase
MLRCLPLSLAALTALAGCAFAYDPLDLPPAKLPEPLDLMAMDAARKREIPVRVYLPAAKSPAAVVLFSHGLGGNRQGSSFLGKHWSARGYVAVFLQHPGSDDSVWKDQQPGNRYAELKAAANLRNFMLRVKDVPAVIDQLQQWNAAGQPLAGRLDLAKLGMSGHSFGAVTTQAVSGQQTRVGVGFTDPRIKAAVIMSPSCPRAGDPVSAFGKVAIPWLLMTGTHDVAPIGDADMNSRLGVFPALPNGSKYELVLDGAEHSAFTDRPLPGDGGSRNPNHHRAILALTTAFWDAYLLDSKPAREWLDGNGPRSVLQDPDRWRKK